MQLLLLMLALMVAQLSCANLRRLGYEYPRPTQTFDDVGQPPTILADQPLVMADEQSGISNDVAVTEAATKGTEPVSPEAQQFANPYYNNNGAYPFGPQSNFAAPFPNHPQALGFQGPQTFAPNFPPGYGPPPFASQPNFPAPFPNYPQQHLAQGLPPGFGAGNGFPAQSFPEQFYSNQNVPNGAFPNAGFPFGGPAHFPFQENSSGFGAGAFARGKRRT